MSGPNTRPHEDPPDPSPEALRFAEEAASVFAAEGFPRLPARVLMALTVSDTGALTSEQLQRILGVSAAAVSSAIGYAHSIHLIRVWSIPGTRRRLYGLSSDDWYRATLSRIGFYHTMAELCEKNAHTLGAGSAPGRRVSEMRAFFEFLEEKFPILLDEWISLRQAGHDRPED